MNPQRFSDPPELSDPIILWAGSLSDLSAAENPPWLSDHVIQYVIGPSLLDEQETLSDQPDTMYHTSLATEKLSDEDFFLFVSCIRANCILEYTGG
jgi:hypothetical protein